MARFGLMLVGLGAIVAVLYFLAARDRESALLQQQARQESAAKLQKQREDEEMQALIRRREGQTKIVAAASDKKLQLLYEECQRQIKRHIESESKPAFAVYFPEYDAYELKQLATMATALSSSTGRPSQILNRDDFASHQVKMLRQFPGRISIVAESASDSFSGVLKWAAEFDCDLDGLSIASVRRVGSRHFFK